MAEHPVESAPFGHVSTAKQATFRSHRAGLSSQMGRSAKGALGQFPVEIADEILRMREAHPGWGPVTIMVELKKDARFVGLQLPSRARKVPRTGYCSLSPTEGQGQEV
jgi:hypothetical protein